MLIAFPTWGLGMLIRREFAALLIIVACFSTVVARLGLAAQGGFSEYFLKELNVECWSSNRAPQHRNQPRSRSLVRVSLRNKGADDMFQMCVYDLVCDEVVFRGRIERLRMQSFSVCSDSKFRGHILVLDAAQTFFMFRDLRSPTTIELRNDHR